MTPPFQVIAVPNVPEPNAPPGFLLLSTADTVPPGINNNGEIVGTYLNLPYPDVEGAGPFGAFGFLDSNGSYAAFFTGQAGSNYCFGVYGSSPRGDNSYPAGLNDSGTIVGNYPGDQFGGIDGFSAQDLSLCSQCKPVGQSISPIVYPGVQPGYYDMYGDQFAGGFLFNGLRNPMKNWGTEPIFVRQVGNLPPIGNRRAPKAGTARCASSRVFRPCRHQ